MTLNLGLSLHYKSETYTAAKVANYRTVVMSYPSGMARTESRRGLKKENKSEFQTKFRTSNKVRGSKNLLKKFRKNS